MSDQITVSVNGSRVLVPGGASVAVAIAIAGAHCRTSVTGEPRRALCAIGICFECRAQIDGVQHQRSCQVSCRDGMQVNTDD